MPNDQTVPIVMVGAGSGIAPLRGFWQQRQHDRQVSVKSNDDSTNGGRKACLKKLKSGLKRRCLCGCFRNTSVAAVVDETCFDSYRKWGGIYLFFGCRNPDLDDIYKEELLEATKQGALTKVFKAFSKAPGQPKVLSSIFFSKNI